MVVVMYIAASKVASVIGANPFESRDYVLVNEIWPKNNPDSFKSVEKQVSIEEVSSNEQVLDVVKEVIQKHHPISLKNARKKLVSDLGAVGNIKNKISKSLEKYPSLTTAYRSKLTNEIDTLIENQEDRKKAHDIINQCERPIEDRVSDVVTDMTTSLEPTQRVETTAQAAKLTRTYQGEVQEAQTQKKLKMTLCNANYYETFIQVRPGLRLRIVGKIDGFKGNELVELKFRGRRQLHKTIREYEKIQVYCYMKMLNLRQATLIESNSHSETMEHVVLFDDSYWDSITSKLAEFVIWYTDEFLTNPSLQQSILLKKYKDDDYSI